MKDDFPYPCFPLVGQSLAIRTVCQWVRRVAPTEAAVLLEGEPGTGKGLVAGLIHDRSRRRGRPFVSLDCRLAEELEAKLQPFDGTLFLDEAGSLGEAQQLKLLKVLEEWNGRAEPAGRPRVIAATRHDLAALAAAGSYREDLYYRLAVVPLRLPPLRERLEDLPALAEAILDRLRERNGAAPRGVSAGALARLRRHCWPGNVRELEAVIEYASVSARGDLIEEADLPEALQGAGDKNTKLENCLADAERRTLERALRNSRTAAEAAERLGLSRATLFRKLRRYGLSIAGLQSPGRSRI